MDAARPWVRIGGVDLARGLAVLGMFAAHVGPDPSMGGAAGLPWELARGRSSALFALLAGLSVMLVRCRAGRTGPAWHRARARLVVRALALIALGTALTSFGTPVVVILAFYGGYFLLSLPITRLSAGRLAAIALVLALGAPPLSFAARSAIEDLSWRDRLWAFDPLNLLGGDGLVELLLVGAYPALTWMPFVLVGMALGRLDLSSHVVRARLAVIALLLALTGYGTPWLFFRAFPVIERALADTAPDAEWGHVTSPWRTDYETGTVDTGTPAGLLVAAPHSGTTFEILGNLGVAVIVLVATLTLTESLPRLTALLRPVTAVGTMPLTAYVGHIAAIWALGIETLPGPAPYVWSAFTITAMVFAAVWSRCFVRGPLEALLHRLCDDVVPGYDRPGEKGRLRRRR